MKANDSLVEHLLDLLKGGNAHTSFGNAVKNFPIDKAGDRPAGAPHSAWELVEHMRIAQHDILKFSQGPDWVSPSWPDGYWPKSAKPAGAAEWRDAVRSFEADLASFEELLRARAAELDAPFAWGNGQTLLREALVVADHNAYHVGQLVLVRRLLGISGRPNHPSHVPPIPLIEFQNVTVQRGERLALDGLTLSIAQGEHVAIMGPNGSGKSTLIKLVAREVYPRLKREPWSLRILGCDCWNLFELRNQLGLVSNDWMEMCTRDYSGYEIVLSGFFGSVGIWPYHHVTPEMERKAREVMELLEIAHLAGRNTSEMSSGEARRILIARALVHDPQALILDEPTTSLDLRATYELREILRKLARNGIGMIMATHNLPDIIPEMGRVVLLAGGRVRRDGPKGEVLTAAAFEDVFGIAVEVLEREGYYHVL